MISGNLFECAVCGYTFTVRWYRERIFGHRYLGARRHAFDFGHISFLFEHYPFGAY